MDFPYFMKILTKGRHMKKKLLVLLIAVIPTLMPNLASAVVIDIQSSEPTPEECANGCGWEGCGHGCDMCGQTWSCDYDPNCCY